MAKVGEVWKEGVSSRQVEYGWIKALWIPSESFGYRIECLDKILEFA